MQNNRNILSENYEKLAVLNMNTGEEIAVITNGDTLISTANEEIVVSLTPSPYANKNTSEIMSILQTLSKPMIEFLNENYNPHCSIIVSVDRIKIVSDDLHIVVNTDDIN